MPQRQSECFRKGRTKQEMRLENCFNKWTTPDIDQVICFECGAQFANPDPTSYPQICASANCRKKYGGAGMYCMPDIVLINGRKKMVVFVNGGVHDMRKRRSKDRYQILRLGQYNYKIWIIKNDEIDRIRESNLLAMTKSIFEAVSDDKLYLQLLKDEKEF